MKKLNLLIILFLFMLLGNAAAQTAFTEQQLEEKIRTNRILTLYATDAGIIGTELNQFGAPSTDFIVPGDYEDVPDNLKILAKEHNVRILPSQVSSKMNAIKFVIPIIIYIAIPLGIIILLFIINRKLTTLINMIKNLGK